MSELDINQVVPVEEMERDYKQNASLLKEMLEEAINYLKSFEWCPGIEKIYFGFGIGRIVGVFLFKFKNKIKNSGDEFLWVVVGDLPSAHFSIDSCSNPKEALETYCHLMEDWVNVVKNKTSLEDVYPVAALPTEEHARMLSSRIESLRKNIIPQYQKGSFVTIPDLRTVVPIEKMAGGSEEETALLKQMLEEAMDYLESFNWCPEIEEVYFGCGIGKVFAVFLFKFKNKIKNSGDEFLWVVVGDLPSAYFVVDCTLNPKEALEAYCELMEDWVNAVRNKTSLRDVYPVKAAPTEEHAQMLNSRIEFLRKDIVSKYDELF